MTKIITCIALLFFINFQATAEEVKLKDSHPTKYYVKEGDTLWGISNMFLQNPWVWPELWHINRQVDNPHLIYPGDEIALVYIKDDKGQQKPVLQVTNRKAKARTVKLTPKKRATKISSSIPTLPLEKVESFLSGNRVIDRFTLKSAPYVLAAEERHLVMGRGNILYARGDWTNPQTAYGIYRGGKPYVDPVTREVLGYEARDLGLAKFISEEDEIATMLISRASEEIREYDTLLPTEARRIEANFYPKSPDGNIQGEIIRVFSGVDNIGQYDVVVVNRGVREGVVNGDIFAIYSRGDIVRDKNKHLQKMQLPSEKGGLMMIFRTFDKVSLGLILKANTLLKVGDEIRQP